MEVVALDTVSSWNKIDECLSKLGFGRAMFLHGGMWGRGKFDLAIENQMINNTLLHKTKKREANVEFSS